MGTQLTKNKSFDHLSYSIQCEYLVFGYLRSISKRWKIIIPNDIGQLSTMFYGKTLVDLIRIDSNDVLCNNLRNKLFPNGIPSKLYYSTFNNDQRKQLWKLLLITKYQRKYGAVFKTFKEFKSVDLSNLMNNLSSRCVTKDTPRTIPQDISEESVRSCLSKFYWFYPNAHYWSAQTILIVPFLYVFNNGKDGTLDTNIDVEYDSYLCYSSLVNHVYSMYYLGHNDKIKNRLLNIKKFWDSLNDNGRGNARKMLECRPGLHAASCLITELMKCLCPEIYKKLQELGINPKFYSYKVSILLLFRNIGPRDQKTPETAIQLYDYLFLFGMGNCILFYIAFIILIKDELMQSSSFIDALKLIQNCETTEWNFDLLCKMVQGFRVTLKKRNPQLLREIMTHINNIDVVIQILEKYY